MNLITLHNITKEYDGFVILDKISLNINKNDKMGIVGRNGAGKSTLAKIIAKEESYNSGDFFISNQLKVGYFSQHSLLDSDLTVYNEMLKVFTKQLELKAQLDQYEKQLQDDPSETVLNEYTNLLARYEEIGGYTFYHELEMILNKFGFKEYYHHPVNHLSGGERTRLALAKLLLEKPDLLILDEPTNHLDIETVEFLENFLKTYPNAILIISHDRYFLNQVVNSIYEIEFKQGFLYKGNYDQFLKLKEERYEKMLKDYHLQQKLIQKEQEFIDKNLVRATTTKRAQSRRKKLEKLERLDDPKLDTKGMKVNFDFTKSSGNIVLTVNQLAVGYDEPIVKNIKFDLFKGEKVAIIGANGVGKSTLLKTIDGLVQPMNGEIKFGTGIEKAYFDQDLAMVNSNKTVLDEIWDENRTMLEKDVRGLLGQFLFTGEDVFKIVNDLSGGEKVRLALVKLLLEKANFLILDEVTNHLDIISKELLEEALIDYEGTILFVSHDRYFINKVATKIIEIKDDYLIEYIGDYNYYLFKKQEIEAKLTSQQDTKNEKNTDFKQTKQQKNYIKKREREAEELELEIEQIEEQIEDLKAKQLTEEVYLDSIKAKEVQSEIERLDSLHIKKIDEWTKITEELTELTT